MHQAREKKTIWEQINNKLSTIAITTAAASKAKRLDSLDMDGMARMCAKIKCLLLLLLLLLLSF